MSKILSNPFFVYVISFGIVIFVYLLGWSYLYPPLSLPVITFFALSAFIAILFGIVISRLKRIEYQRIHWHDRTGIYVTLVLVGYSMEFVYNKGIPLSLIIQGADYDYTKFGIPSFHVFMVTFSSFLSVFIFHQLCDGFSRRRLLWFLLSILPPVLIVNRGMLLITLTACLFVYLLSLKTFGPGRMAMVTIAILVIFFFFGVLGNLRQTHGKSTSSEYILKSGMATESFTNSLIPDEYIWSYLYISSPMANLQHTIDRGVTSGSWLGFVNFELLPDFISKRTGSALDIKRETMPRVAPWLTVSTFYAHPYLFIGWAGIIIIYLFFLLTTFLYVVLFPKQSKFYVTGLALLNTLVLYNTFDNMYSFSGLNFQLLYPFILGYVKFPNITLRSLFKYGLYKRTSL